VFHIPAFVETAAVRRLTSKVMELANFSPDSLSVLYWTANCLSGSDGHLPAYSGSTFTLAADRDLEG
jgi:hypothetical protein